MRLTHVTLGAICILWIVLPSVSLAAETSDQRYPHLRTRLKRGQEIVAKISALSSKQIEAFNVATFRDEVVEFVGGGAIPGATNDLQIEGDYYIRVVTSPGKDLRPQATTWEVHVKGKILQVLPKHKIIVLEVQEKDWIVLQTL